MKCFSQTIVAVGLSCLIFSNTFAQEKNLLTNPEILDCYNHEFDSGVVNFITEGEKLTRDVLRVTAVLVLDGETHGPMWPFTSNSEEARYLLVKLVDAFTGNRDLLQTSVCQRTFLASDINFSTDENNADTQVMLSFGKDGHSLVRAIDFRDFQRWGLKQPQDPMTILRSGPQQVLVQTHHGEEIRESLNKLHGRHPQVLKFSAPHPNGERKNLEGIEVHIYPDSTRGNLNAREVSMVRSYFSTFFRYLGISPRLLLGSNGTHGDSGFPEEYNEQLQSIQSKGYATLYEEYLESAEAQSPASEIKNHQDRRIMLRRRAEAARAYANSIIQRKPMECNNGRCSHFPNPDITDPKTFYFFFGYVDFPRVREAIKVTLSPTIEVLKAKGYSVKILDDATSLDLLGALKNPDLHSIYWFSHNREGKYTASLYDSDHSPVPFSIFEQTLERHPEVSLRSVTLVGCDPGKALDGYGLRTLGNRRAFELFYPHEEGDLELKIDLANLRVKNPESILNRGFLKMIDELPIISPEARTYSEIGLDQAVIRMDVADAVVMGRKYHVLLDDEIIGSILPNTAPGFQTMSFVVPKAKLSSGKHTLKVVTPSRAVNLDENDLSNLLDDILIRNVRAEIEPGYYVIITEYGSVIHIGDDRGAFGVLSSDKWLSIDSRGEFENAAEGRINFSMDLNRYWNSSDRPDSYLRVRFNVPDTSRQ